jgi:predicted DNA-binding transcriptional regulator AlpA
VNADPPLVLESFAELRARGVVSSRTTLHWWQATAGFPRPIKLGARKAGFVGAEIEAWIAARAAARDGSK